MHEGELFDERKAMLSVSRNGMSQNRVGTISSFCTYGERNLITSASQTMSKGFFFFSVQPSLHPLV